VSDTMHMLVDHLKKQGVDLDQVGQSGIWVVRTPAGLIDLGPTPRTGYEWERLLRRLRFAGVELPSEEEE